MQPVRVVARGHEEGRGGDDTDTVELEERRGRLADEAFEGVIDAAHLVVEVPDATGEATDHDIGVYVTGSEPLRGRIAAASDTSPVLYRSLNRARTSSGPVNTTWRSWFSVWLR